MGCEESETLSAIQGATEHEWMMREDPYIQTKARHCPTDSNTVQKVSHNSCWGGDASNTASQSWKVSFEAPSIGNFVVEVPLAEFSNFDTRL